MKIKNKILVVALVVSVIFSFVCVSASAYGFTENRTDLPSLTNRNLVRLNNYTITTYGDDGSHSLDLGLERWDMRDYYANGKVTVYNNRNGLEQYLYYNSNIYYNENSPFSLSRLTYTSNDITKTFYHLNGIDVYSKQFVKHSNDISEYYDEIEIGTSVSNISSANIAFDYLGENGAIKHYTFIAEVGSIDSGKCYVKLLPDQYDLNDTEVWYNLKVRINFNDTINISTLSINSPYCSEDTYNTIVSDNIDYIKHSYNSAPRFESIWDLFASAVEAFFAVKIFDTISLGSILLIVVGVFLFRLVLKVFAGD